MSDTNPFQTYRVNILLKTGAEMSRKIMYQSQVPLTITNLMFFQGGEWIGWKCDETFFNKDFVASVEILEIKQ